MSEETADKQVEPTFQIPTDEKRDKRLDDIPMIDLVAALKTIFKKVEGLKLIKI